MWSASCGHAIRIRRANRFESANAANLGWIADIEDEDARTSRGDVDGVTGYRDITGNSHRV